MKISPRDCFWIWNASVQKRHVHVVLTHPEPSEKGILKVAVVSLTTVRAGIAYDATTVVQPSDFPPYITHPSWVYYSKAEFKSVLEIEDEIRNPVGGGSRDMYSIPIGKIPQGLFERICDGLQDSDFADAEVQGYCFERHPGDGVVTVGKHTNPVHQEAEAKDH